MVNAYERVLFLAKLQAKSTNPSKDMAVSLIS